MTAMATNMTLEDFKSCADLYSADLSRWPRDLIHPARALIEASPEAKSYFDDMLALDAVLRAEAPRAPDLAKLEAKILKAVLEAEKAPADLIPAAQALGKSSLARVGGGLLMAALIGFVVGVLQPAARADYVMDPVYYTQDQIIRGDDIALNTEGMF